LQLATSDFYLFVILQDEQLETARTLCLDLQVISGFFLLPDSQAVILVFQQ
jgi:hypothetical protein